MLITRRVHRMILLVALLIGGVGMNYVQAATYSGTCGAAGNEANVTWELNTETGIFKIDGTGPMAHYWPPNIPWYNYRQYATSIFVSTGVTTVGHHAFYDFPNVKRIYLYSTLTSIGVLSFGFCRKVTALEIPNSVTSIGEQALWYNESLKDVYVTWKDDAVPDMPANIHNFEASQIKLHIPCGQEAAYTAKGWNTKFTLQEALDANVIKLSTDNFPWSISCDSVLTVSGTGAMSNFPEPQYQTIANLRFVMNSPALSPFFSKQKVIKEAIFEEGITYIGNNTFHKDQYRTGYTNFTTLTLPSTLTSMSSTAFKGCIALKDVYVSWTTAAAIPTWNQTIDVSSTTLHVPCGTTALYQAKGWQNFIIKEERGHGTCGAQGKNLTWTLSCDGVLTISGTGEMYNWMSLADRPWHSLRTSIQRVVIEEGVTTTGLHAFYGASNLTSVSLPSTLQTLQFMTFFGCSKLTTLTIPSSVTSVGNRCLEGCAALTDVYTSETGDAVPTMPPGIHTYDASRIRLHIPCGQAGAYFAKGWNTKFTLPDVVSGTCGDNVQWTYESCNGLLSIFGTGPMADYTNTNQIPWYSNRSSITSVIIFDGVTSIGRSAFYNCSSLTSLTVPPSVTSIGSNAFYGCWTMESLYITDLAAWCNISQSDSSAPFIRNSYDNYRGGGNLYINGVHVTTLTIPDGITEIPYRAFSGFAGITSIQFNQVTTIGLSAFSSCHGLTEVMIQEGVTTINTSAFRYCSNLQSISIPASAMSLGDYILSNCKEITDIYVHWTENIPVWPTQFTTKYPQSSVTLHVPCSAMSLYKAADGWKDYHIEGEGGPYIITVESDDPSMGTVDAIKIDN